MRARLSPTRLAQRLATPLSPLQVLACAVVLLLADWADQRTSAGFFPGAPLDETAHFLTALLLLQLLLFI